MDKVELSSIYGTMVSTMLDSLQATLDTVLKEYTEASLSVLEGALLSMLGGTLNSDMSRDEALSKLKETYATYNGKYDGCVCMFKRLIGDKLFEIMKTDLYVTFDRFMIDLNITYSKHIYRLDEIYRENERFCNKEDKAHLSS